MAKANKKKLLKAAVKFRNENPNLYHSCSKLLTFMAEFIERSGAAEVTVGYKNGRYYEYTNN